MDIVETDPILQQRRQETRKQRRDLRWAFCSNAACPRKSTGLRGESPKSCAKCKSASYCSKESFRPKHKKTCEVPENDERPLSRLVKALLMSNVLPFYVLFCVIRHFQLDAEMPASLYNGRYRRPLCVQFICGLEPSSVASTHNLWKYGDAWNYTGVEAIFQLHEMETVEDPSEEMISGWEFARKNIDAMGYPFWPVVSMRFVDATGQCAYGTMPIHQYIFDALQRAGPIPNHVAQVETELIEAGPKLDIANFINHINEEIRLDEKNCLKLRAPMRLADKKLILDAYRDVAQCGPQAFRFKTFRERIYESPTKHVLRVGRVLKDNDLSQAEKNKTAERMMRLAIAGTPAI